MAASKIEEIKTALAERLKVEKIDENAEIKNLGLDSLDVVEMCLDLEDKYGIQFATEELAAFKTIGDLISSIENKIGA